MSSKVSASTSFSQPIPRKTSEKDSVSKFVEDRLSVSFQKASVTKAQFSVPSKQKNMELLEKFVIQKINDGIQDINLIYEGFIQKHGLLLTGISLKIPELPQIFRGVEAPKTFNERYQSLTKNFKTQVREEVGKSAIKDLQNIERKFKYLKTDIQSILTYKTLEQAFHNRFFEAPLSEKIKRIAAPEVVRILSTNAFESSSSPKKSKKMYTDQQLSDAKVNKLNLLPKSEAAALYAQLTDPNIFFSNEIDSLKDELIPIFSKRGYCVMLLAGLKNLVSRKASPLFSAFNNWQLAELENWMGDRKNINPSAVVAQFCNQRQLEIVNVYEKIPIFSLLQALSSNTFEILIKYLHSEYNFYFSEESDCENSFIRNNSEFTVLHSKKIAIKNNKQKCGTVDLILEVTGELGSDQFGVKFKFSNLKFIDEFSWDQRILVFKELGFNVNC